MTLRAAFLSLASVSLCMVLAWCVGAALTGVWWPG